MARITLFAPYRIPRVARIAPIGTISNPNLGANNPIRANFRLKELLVIRLLSGRSRVGPGAPFLLLPLASADQSYPEGEEQHGECRREYAEGLRTKLIEIACCSEH